MDAGPFVEGNGEVGAGRRKGREEEREKERLRSRRRKEKRKSEAGVLLEEDGDADADDVGGVTPTPSSSSASSSSPSFFPPLRFRAAGKGECAASECSLLCNDLLRRGARGLELEASRTTEAGQEEAGEEENSSPSLSQLRRAAPARMLVDPGVRVAYTLADAAHLRSRERVKGIGSASWKEVSKAPSIDWGDNEISSAAAAALSSSPALLPDPSWEACCLKPGADAIVWSEDCGWDSWLEPWRPATFLGSGAARRRRGAGFEVDEEKTVVGRDHGNDDEEEEEVALLPPPRK